jgi:hypothetical protein
LVPIDSGHQRRRLQFPPATKQESETDFKAFPAQITQIQIHHEKRQKLTLLSHFQRLKRPENPDEFQTGRGHPFPITSLIEQAHQLLAPGVRAPRDPPKENKKLDQTQGHVHRLLRLQRLDPPGHVQIHHAFGDQHRGPTMAREHTPLFHAGDLHGLLHQNLLAGCPGDRKLPGARENAQFPGRVQLGLEVDVLLGWGQEVLWTQDAGGSQE